MSGVIKSSVDRSPVGQQSMPLVKLNGRLSPTSPLKVFGQAKSKINNIFVELSSYIEEGVDFLKEVETEGSLIVPEQVAQFMKCKDKVKGIREILTRDRMKVAFFGRTSNGKSSVINAMLRNKILPSGMGHTTNCFLQVEGDEGSEPYYTNEQEPDVKNMGLKSLSTIANAQSKSKLTNDTLIRIHYPKDLCSLLRDDVVLVDSPGIDVSPDLDSWIEKFCLDADVFVLVANAESTLMQTEKNFFHRVSERLSKPNIFILNNRWDASASEMETMEEVKQQHLERNIEFLVDELKVATPQEARDRVFFVSAKEALMFRNNQDNGKETPASEMMEGAHMRLYEFANFERKFEECISQSAVETKFALHAQNGKDITKFFFKTMENICLEAVDMRMVVKKEHEDCVQRLDATRIQMNELSESIKENITKMTEEVHLKVRSALSEEIRRLSVLVDTFDVPFTDDNMLIHDYKRKLHSHVEAGLSTNLQTRCSEALMSTISDTTKEMAEQILVLVPEESRRKAVSIFPSDNFEMAYRLDCRNLCSDFNEDISFQFKYGFSNMLTRFARMRMSKESIPRSLSSGSMDDLGSVLCGNDNDALMALLPTFTKLYSWTTLGGVALLVVAFKAISWKLVMGAGSLYSLLYLYERLTWTMSAKEKTFKKQYVDYASSKLRLIVDFTSTNCSCQVQQQLYNTFNLLCQQVNLTKSDLEDDLKKLEKEMKQLDESSKKANSLKNKAQFTDNELTNFIKLYISSMG